MDLGKLKEVLDAVSQKNCDEGNIIEEIKQELQERYPDFYQEWKRSNFNIDHKICIYHNDNIVEDTTLSHLAADGGHTNIVRLLIKNGANVNAKKEFKRHGQINEINLSPRSINTISGYPLLYSVIKHGDESLARSLINRGADVNVRAADGWTPLHCAAAYGNENIVNLLIQNNANVYDRILSKTYPTGVTNFFTQNNANVYDKIPECRSLFKDYSFTPLHFAALNGNYNMVKILMENGANPLLYERVGNLGTPKASFTPLDLAAANNHYDIVKLFIENGTNPLFRNEEGKISRAYAKDKNIIELLKETENKYLRNQAIKFGVICGGIAAMAIMIGCIAVNIELVTAIISVTAAFVLGACIAGGITYFESKPDSELNEAELTSAIQPERALSS